jgi:formamidopyrimidine-DNA glycosylase
MPELPEVETIRHQIQKVLPLKIKNETRSKEVVSLLRKAKAPEFFKTQGQTLSQARRHGKVLVLDFANAGTVLSGLGMSGGWRITSSPCEEKHTHLAWEGVALDGKKIFLSYVDPRRFGALAFLSPEEAQLRLSKLGVDVASPMFNFEYVSGVFKRHPERELKPFLLEQKYFAGVGNYIASEMCAHAGVRPTRRLKSLTKKETLRLIESAAIVLNGIQGSGGLTFSGGYKDTSGSDGGGLDHLVVFHQESCGLCHQTSVKKIVMAGRGTFYCPRCQR